MKRKLILAVLITIIAAVCIPPAWSQLMCTVRGTVKDVAGKPLAGASIEYLNTENGRKYTFKTDAKGQFFSIGVYPGTYKITTSVNGAPVTFTTNVPVRMSEENVFDIDLAKEKQAAKANMSAEQKKASEAAEKEKAKIKNLNDRLDQARKLQEAGNYEQAVTILAEATQIDANQHILWFNLADAQRLSASKTTDRDEAKKKYEAAIASYKKAVELKPSVGAYYNNMAEAYAKIGDTQNAIEQYTAAALNDPANAGQYYFNLGAVLTNSNKIDEAINAFDKAIAADPTRADAYYWKGVNMIGKSKLEGTKMIAPPGTAEAFNKYLELDPNGKHVSEAKEMMGMIGATIETSYGKKGATPKKK